MKKNKPLSSNMEDYLEAIYVIAREQGKVGVKAISDYLAVSKPSVTGAIAELKIRKLINHERYGKVELTVEGEKIALKIKKRHEMSVRFLVDVLQVDEQVAEKDACRMEHALSQETAEKLRKFLLFISSAEGGTPPWLTHFSEFLKTGKKPKCKHEK